MLRNVLDTFEPAFRGLLLPACPIKLNNLHIYRIVEVGDGRVIERQMTVFSDTEETQLRIGGTDRFGVRAASSFRIIGASINFKEMLHLHFFGQPLAKITAE